jgi:hypothetical protein
MEEHVQLYLQYFFFSERKESGKFKAVIKMVVKREH